VRLWRITRWRSIFRTTLGNTDSRRSKPQIFSQIIAKFRLDNTTGIQYLNSIIGCRSTIAV
ncbi:MAG: hypothetical protein V3S05_07000, partial [Desulfobacterales bacterium]